MKLAVIGTGYVGLVSGVCLASKGHNVTCVDIDSEKVRKINSKISPIHEDGLPELLATVVEEGKFTATMKLWDALDNCDAVIVAVGTPSMNGKIDLTYLKLVSREIGNYLKTKDRFLSIIIKSTVLPSTTDTVVKHEIEMASGKVFGNFGLGMNPEFLREGKAILDFNNPDRIVLGFEDAKTLEILEEIYAPWDVDKLKVNTRTAEMIKYSNNCLLALQISAANELANLASRVGGIDFMDVMRGVSLDKRWNPILANGLRANPEILTYLVPGPGFGGSCFPKDVQAIRTQGENLGLEMNILNSVLRVNETQPEQVGMILSNHFGNLKEKNILILGLAFKPDTDDIRESASIKIIADLIRRGANIFAHDPIAQENFAKLPFLDHSKITYPKSWKEQVVQSDAIILVTNWEEYRSLSSFDLKDKVLFDTRRLINPQGLKGVKYFSIGRYI